jgi:hypothetical protein
MQTPCIQISPGGGRETCPDKALQRERHLVSDLVFVQVEPVASSLLVTSPLTHSGVDSG